MADPGAPSNTYTGRFAPSPTGRLHFGSLVAAVASYLDARHARGKWLVRIEDLDPPRQQAGASADILRCLEAHHLHWDDTVLYQSQRLSAYEELFEDLHRRRLVYPCYCTRKTLTTVSGPYPGTCRQREQTDQPAAWRLLTEDLPNQIISPRLMSGFDDLFRGHYTTQHPLGDFILKRRDGLFAYQFAVVVDDCFQGVNHVIRGVDIIDSTTAQQFLFQLLGCPLPRFGHIPVVLNHQQQKLSKRHGARAIDPLRPEQNLVAALHFLNHPPEQTIAAAGAREILAWACANWDRGKIPLEDQQAPKFQLLFQS